MSYGHIMFLSQGAKWDVSRCWLLLNPPGVMQIIAKQLFWKFFDTLHIEVQEEPQCFESLLGGCLA